MFKPTASAAVARHKLVAKALEQEGRATASMLMKLTGKSITSVRDTLRKLHNRDKIYIGAYEPSSHGRTTIIWCWGNGDDARKPDLVKPKEKFIAHPDMAAAWLRNPV